MLDLLDKREQRVVAPLPLEATAAPSSAHLVRVFNCLEDWGVIARVPCAIKLLKAPKGAASFHDFDEFERLVKAAQGEQSALLLLLLGGEAGLRCGEMMALEWKDVDQRHSTLPFGCWIWQMARAPPKRPLAVEDCWRRRENRADGGGGRSSWSAGVVPAKSRRWRDLRA